MNSEINNTCDRFIGRDASFDVLDRAISEGICGRSLPAVFLPILLIVVVLTHHFCGL